MRRHPRCSIGGSASTNEIPPLGTLLHLSNEETNGFRAVCGLRTVKVWDYGQATASTGGVVRVHPWAKPLPGVPLLHRGVLSWPRGDPTVLNTAQIGLFRQFESLVSRHLPDGEFGWGGISVTRQRRCPKAGSVGTELSRGTQA